MSKILVRGTKHLKPKYEYKVECDKCGSVILLENGEMKHEYDQREHDEWWMWKCPVCGAFHQIFNHCQLYALKYDEHNEE